MSRDTAGQSGAHLTRFSVPLCGYEGMGFEFDPSLTLVRIPRSLLEGLGEGIGVLEFPVRFAGDVASTPAVRAVRSLAKRSERYLHEIGMQGNSHDRFARNLITNEVAAKLLYQQAAPAIRTVVQWNLKHLLTDAQIGEWYADDYASGNQDVEARSIREALEALQPSATEQYASPALAGILEGVAQEYSRPAASTVAKLALRPKLTSVMDQQPDLQQIEQLDIHERCRQLAQVLETLYTKETEISAQVLKQDIQAESELPIQDPEADQQELPVVDVPRNVPKNRTQSVSPIGTNLTGYPTGMTWLLTRALREGEIGGVLYPHEDGTKGWLVNPWADSYWENGSYRECWSRAVVADSVISHLITLARGNKAPKEVHCPLCDNALTRCGGQQCTHRDIVNWAETESEAQVTAIQEVFSSLNDSYAELFEESDDSGRNRHME